MAASMSQFVRPNYPGETNSIAVSDSLFELNESDIWNVSVELRKTVPTSRIVKRSSPMAVTQGEGGGTVTVNVPDWCKILKGDNRSEDEDYKSVEDRIPPHEFLARTRMASFSVHEGIGRTLKGRDLSRLRNAVWERTGFED